MALLQLIRSAGPETEQYYIDWADFEDLDAVSDPDGI
jgi:hypothetical protein